MPVGPEKSKSVFTPEVIEGVFSTEALVAQDERWARLGPEDAPLARAAIVKAEALRHGESDAGEAYLAGVTDRHVLAEQQRWLEAFSLPDTLPDNRAA